jgi:hypothetical protein
MNTNKNITDEKLGELFKEIPFDNPSSDFMEKLLVRIDKEVLREKRKQQWMIVMQIAAGISGIFILPALTLYLCTLFLPGFSFTFPQIQFNLKIDPNLIIIGFSILMLLICDTLFRIHAVNRKKHEFE